MRGLTGWTQRQRGWAWLKQQRWVQFLHFVAHRFEQDQCRDKAGALTYTSMLSIVPMLTVFLVIVSSIPALASARAQIQDLLYRNLLPRSSIQISQYLNEFAEKSANLTVLGVVFLFITAVMMLSTIEQAFNHVWRVKRARGGVIGLMRYWTIISLGPILLGGAFAASSALASIEILNQNFAGYAIDWAAGLQVLSLVLTLAGFTFLYWLIPNCQVPVKHAALAGVVAGLLFELLKMAFGWVIGNFTSYDQVYGAFAALPILVMWIYLSWNIVLVGVEISYARTVFEAAPHPPRHPVLVLLDLLQLFYHKQQSGAVVCEHEALQVLGRGEVERWTEYTDILQRCQLIRKTEHGAYVLCRNLAQVDFWTFYGQLPYPLPRREDLQHAHANDTWLDLLEPALLASDAYLRQQLSLPLSRILEN